MARREPWLFLRPLGLTAIFHPMWPGKVNIKAKAERAHFRWCIALRIPSSAGLLARVLAELSMIVK